MKALADAEWCCAKRQEVELGCMGSMYCSSGSELVGWTYMS